MTTATACQDNRSDCTKGAKHRRPSRHWLCIARVLNADQFVVEDLHVTFASNGKVGPKLAPQQLELKFDKDDGVTLRIQSASEGLTIKAISA